jgi:hypothetical protein
MFIDGSSRWSQAGCGTASAHRNEVGNVAVPATHSPLHAERIVSEFQVVGYNHRVVESCRDECGTHGPKSDAI